MKTTVFNELCVTYPDDFYIMTPEEVGKYFSSDMLRWGAKNAEKHIVIVLAKTKASFLNLITDAKGVAAGAESSLRKSLKDYKCVGDIESELIGKKAECFGFEYLTDDGAVSQYCETAVVKAGRSYYIAYCFCRSEDKEQYSPMFAEFRKSAQIVNE